MLEARISKVGIGSNQKNETVLLCVAEYNDLRVNLQSTYEWETLDREGFIKDLRDKLAEEFDLPAYRVDVRERFLLEKMKEGWEWNEKGKKVIYH